MDIVERLHNLYVQNGTNYVQEAAQEIKRLRSEAQNQKHRADVLAATVRALQDVVTHDAETKADFIARVRSILSEDPDARLARIQRMEASEAALQRMTENAEELGSGSV